MKTKRMWLIVALSTAVVMLMVPSQEVFPQEEHGRVEGWIDSSDPFDGWSLGPAADYICCWITVEVETISRLDVEVCLALVLPSRGGFLRHELICTDQRGRGGDETLRVHISSSDFPNLTWLFNAILVVEVWRFSGSGSYDLHVWVEC